MNNVTILFKRNNKAITDGVTLGCLSANGVSEPLIFDIAHNSNYTINQCGIFLNQNYTDYDGGNNPDYDYRTLLWLADNYPGYGLVVRQEYVVYGDTEKQDSKRLFDVKRKEKKDIFTGQYVEILGGPSAGEKRRITGFDNENCYLELDSDFTTDVVGIGYVIKIVDEKIIKTGIGSSMDCPIPILYNAGNIPRFETAQLSLHIKTPPFIKKAMNYSVNLGLKYTPEE